MQRLISLRSGLMGIILFVLYASRLASGQIGSPMGPAPDYVPSTLPSGVIHVWGSPQMRDMLHRYEEGFGKVQPQIRFQEDLFSTLTAAAGVFTGRAQIGLLGREIWSTETEAFASVKGHPPTVVDVATGSLDVPKATFALMIFVPSKNPLASLSTAQLERLFSAAPGRAPLREWGQLGLRGAWQHRPIHLYGFAPDNDKSRIFSNLVFHPGDAWASNLTSFVNQSGANGHDAGELIVRAVEADPNGIGISNIHYATPRVRTVALRTSAGQPAIQATRQTVATRAYPLTRAVYMIIDQNADRPDDAAVFEFLRFVLSRQGQEAVQAEGNYLPLTPALAARERARLVAPSPGTIGGGISSVEPGILTGKRERCKGTQIRTVV